MTWSWYCPLANAEITLEHCRKMCTDREISQCTWSDLQHRMEDEHAATLEAELAEMQKVG